MPKMWIIKVDEKHVIYIEDDSIVIDRITEEINGELIVDADLDHILYLS